MTTHRVKRGLVTKRFFLKNTPNLKIALILKILKPEAATHTHLQGAVQFKRAYFQAEVEMRGDVLLGKANMESPFALKPIPFGFSFCLPAPSAFPTPLAAPTRGDARYPEPGRPPPQDLRGCTALAASALPQPKEQEVPVAHRARGGCRHVTQRVEPRKPLRSARLRASAPAAEGASGVAAAVVVMPAPRWTVASPPPRLGGHGGSRG